MVEKVIATPAALELVEFLKQKHGTLMFHQSGGCCDNSAANCYLPGEITMGAGDVHLGTIGGCDFYISKSQYATWKHTKLIIDVIDGHGGIHSGFTPDGLWSTSAMCPPPSRTVRRTSLFSIVAARRPG